MELGPLTSGVLKLPIVTMNRSDKALHPEAVTESFTIKVPVPEAFHNTLMFAVP